MADDLADPQSLASQQPSTLDLLFHAIHGQESGYGANPATSPKGAMGDMQIEPGTFQQFALPGESIVNKADNIRVGRRILATYLQQYNGDASRAAVAYFSGPGNVSPPGYPTPFLHNGNDGHTTVAQYVAGIGQRMGDPNVQAMALRGSYGLEQDSSLSPSSLAPQPPRNFLDSAGDAITQTADKRAEQPQAAQKPPGLPIAPMAAGPLGLQPGQMQQPIPSQVPRTMDYYLAMLKHSATPEMSSG